MRASYYVKINKRDGSMEFLGDPPPNMVLPRISKTRFSEIVPVFLPARWLFRLLRWAFGEDGRCAEWTRHWPCEWKGTILMGSHKGETMRHWNRWSILQWEREAWFHPKTKDL